MSIKSELEAKDVVIAKLQAIIDDYERDKFSEDELSVLHRMIDLWQAFEVLGQDADFARNVFIWVAGFTLLWFMPLADSVKVIKRYLGFE